MTGGLLLVISTERSEWRNLFTDVSTSLDMTGGRLDMTGGRLDMTGGRLDMTVRRLDMTGRQSEEKRAVSPPRICVPGS